jgi:hypothetical protein
MKRKTQMTIPAVLFLIFSCVLPVLADQPRMFEARGHLENALKYLKRASADKGGHRERALGLTSQAITAVNNGIEYDRTHYTPGRRRNSDFNHGSLQPMSAMPDQPNMVSARAYLESAVSQLNRASADKGGFREEALRLAHAAIAEVDAGIEYDRTH